ncbi:MAG: glycosyltransferase family 2 protein [Pseudomonadota bacterium]
MAIITKNEEERLPECLKSVFFADEVLVVDSGSLDRTVEIARALRAKVIIENWRGFSEQKQFAVNRCKNDWVMVLDADERVPKGTAKVIQEELSKGETDIQAYSFRRKNYLHGRWIKHCGWWPDQIVRLVNRRRGRFDGRLVHEKWIVDGKVKSLGAFIEHVSFRNYSDLVTKMENYSNLASKEMMLHDVRVGPLTPLGHGVWMFIKSYLLRMGILDGFDGFVISIMNAGGSFLKYAKLREQYIKHGTLNSRI